MPDPEQKLKRAIIKEELVALTGEWLKAVILQQFLYWGERVKDFDAFILEERLRKNEPDLELTHGWIWKSAKDLKEEIMVTPLSEDTVRRRMAELVKAGWLEERNNPYHAWDRTLQYRPSLRQIQKDLQDLGYALEHYPLLIENSPIPQGAESNPHDAESNLDGAESNPQGAGALPETTPETTPQTTPERESPSLREQAQNGEMTPETEVALLCGFGRDGKGGVADPSQDQAKFIKYGDEAVQAFIDNGGDIGRLQNERDARRDAIVNFANRPDFDLDRFANSVRTCIPVGGVQPDNLGCIFDTYNNGGDYQEMQKAKKNGGNRASTNRRDDKQRDPGEKFLDPGTGQFVRRDPATGDLVPVS